MTGSNMLIQGLAAASMSSRRPERWFVAIGGALLGDDDPVIRLQVAFDDLGELSSSRPATTAMATGLPSRRTHTCAWHLCRRRRSPPPRRPAHIAEPGSAHGRRPALIDDDPRCRRHAGLERQIGIFDADAFPHRHDLTKMQSDTQCERKRYNAASRLATCHLHVDCLSPSGTFDAS